MSKKQGDVIQPQPSMTLFDINELTQNQRFDVTALVEDNATIDILRNAVRDKEPLTLFGLSGKKLGSGYSRTGYSDDYILLFASEAAR